MKERKTGGGIPPAFFVVFQGGGKLRILRNMGFFCLYSLYFAVFQRFSPWFYPAKTNIFARYNRVRRKKDKKKPRAGTRGEKKGRREACADRIQTGILYQTIATITTNRHPPEILAVLVTKCPKPVPPQALTQSSYGIPRSCAPMIYPARRWQTVGACGLCMWTGRAGGHDISPPHLPAQAN